MTTAASPYLNAIPRAESELRARAFPTLPPGPDLTGSPLLDTEVRALFDDCNRWGRGDARTVSSLVNALQLWRWRDTPPRKSWGSPDITDTHKAKAREIVTGWLELARKKP